MYFLPFSSIYYCICTYTLYILYVCMYTIFSNYFQKVINSIWKMSMPIKNKEEFQFTRILWSVFFLTISLVLHPGESFILSSLMRFTETDQTWNTSCLLLYTFMTCITQNMYVMYCINYWVRSSLKKKKSVRITLALDRRFPYILCIMCDVQM